MAENNRYNFVMLVSSWSDSPIWFPMCLHKCGEETFRGSVSLVLVKLHPAVNLLPKEECSIVMVIHIIEIAEFLLKLKKKKGGKNPVTKPKGNHREHYRTSQTCFQVSKQHRLMFLRILKMRQKGHVVNDTVEINLLNTEPGFEQ